MLIKTALFKAYTKGKKSYQQYQHPLLLKQQPKLILLSERTAKK